jgi:hypothetical protein
MQESSDHVPHDKRALSLSRFEANRVSGETRYPKILEDQGLLMSGQASLGSMPRGHDTKN